MICFDGGVGVEELFEKVRRQLEVAINKQEVEKNFIKQRLFPTESTADFVGGFGGAGMFSLVVDAVIGLVWVSRLLVPLFRIWLLICRSWFLLPVFCT